MRYAFLGLIVGACMVGQPVPAGGSYTGQSWIGLLVSADCQVPQKAHSRADAEANLTVTDRVTTPAVDQSGTRGKSTLLTDEGDANRNATPKTGDTRERGNHQDPAWKAAQKQAAALPSSCGVDTDTSRFGLLLPEGEFLRFDELANQGIVKQLKANPPAKKSILRVQAAGKLQRGLIALDTIQL